jgi:hypothetical protein
VLHHGDVQRGFDVGESTATQRHLGTDCARDAPQGVGTPDALPEAGRDVARESGPPLTRSEGRNRGSRRFEGSTLIQVVCGRCAASVVPPAASVSP